MKYAREASNFAASHRFLGDWCDDHELYQALMDSGLTFAKASCPRARNTSTVATAMA